MKSVIIFTKLPNDENSKTRLKDILTKNDRALLVDRLLRKNLSYVKKYKVFFAIDNPNTLIPDYIKEYEYFKQTDGDIGKRMFEAINHVYKITKGPVILIGSDILDFDSDIFDQAFLKLKNSEVVFSETLDGGYSLIGMNHPIREIFGGKYSTKNVSKNLRDMLKSHSYSILRKTQDIDDVSDIARFILKQDAIEVSKNIFESKDFRLYLENRNDKTKLDSKFKDKLKKDDLIGISYVLEKK
ncbi:MAG: DUF2064 domain-containing protein [Tissierellia bacterium]|nr:DUF2064 domain-containing protein [Tissierellia bacterium]